VVFSTREVMMATDEEPESVKASPRDLSLQIRNWVVALMAVAGLVEYLIANPTDHARGASNWPPTPSNPEEPVGCG